MTLILATLLGVLVGLRLGRRLARPLGTTKVPTTVAGVEKRNALRTAIHVLTRLQGYAPTRVYPARSDGYDTTPGSDDLARSAARSKGLTVIESTKHTLLLDLDDGRDIDPEVLGELQDHFGDFAIETWASKSGKGTHAVLTFPFSKFSEAEAIALEIALGSDPRRGALNVVRLRNKISNPRFLFRP